MVSHQPSVNRTLFFSSLEPATPITPPVNIIDGVLKVAEDNIQHETSKPATAEITSSELKEKQGKLIQKETMETGSVSFFLFNNIY
jgi:hypothetical protein